MTALTIDSSVYLSAFLTPDPFYKPSHRFLQAVRRQKRDIILPSLVPLEVLNNLHRQGLPTAEVAKIFQGFYETERVRIVAIDYALGTLLIPEIKRFDIKTADWLIAATAFHYQTRLVSWDQKFLEKTKTILASQNPVEWLAGDA